jgi:hypothetical protein
MLLQAEEADMGFGPEDVEKICREHEDARAAREEYLRGVLSDVSYFQCHTELNAVFKKAVADAGGWEVKNIDVIVQKIRDAAPAKNLSAREIEWAEERLRRSEKFFTVLARHGLTRNV